MAASAATINEATFSDASGTLQRPWPKIGTIVHYLARVWECRYFWLSLVRMDLALRYRRSLLGVGWSVVHPLAMATVLCLVFHQILQVEIRVYAPFVLSGLAVWHFLSTVAIQGSQCFLQAERYLRQYPAPLAIYPLRSTLAAGFHFLVVLALVWLLGAVMVGLPSLPAVAAVLPTIILIFLAAWCLTTILGLMSVFFPDLPHLAEVGLQILFYATPILYPVTLLEGRPLGWLLRANPLSAWLDLVRIPVLEGHAPSFEIYLLATSHVLLLAVLVLVLLRRLERRLIFHL